MRRVRATKPILAVVGFAASKGVPPLDLLSAAGLDPALLCGPDVDIAHATELRLWDEAARLSGNQHFGLHLAEWAVERTEELFDVLAFAARSCATLGDQYRRVGRYIRLIHGGVYLSLEEEADVARLVHGHIHEPSEPPRHPVEGQLALAILQGRRSVGEDLAPREVRFTHAAPAQVSEHARIFAAPVRFGCSRNELVLDRHLLDRPQRHAEPRLLAMLERQLDGLMTGIPDGDDFLDRVRACVMEALPDGEPEVAAIAEKLHVSPRSLQRRLRSEGTSFAEILSELRRGLALRYLEDRRIAIGEVGFLLGFAEVSAFYRAFKRWTGITPANYQRSAHVRRASAG